MAVSGENFKFNGIIAGPQRGNLDNHLPLTFTLSDGKGFVNIALAHQENLREPQFDLGIEGQFDIVFLVGVYRFDFQ